MLIANSSVHLIAHRIVSKVFKNKAGEMAQKLKAPAANSNYLGLIPRTHKGGGNNQFLKVGI